MPEDAVGEAGVFDVVPAHVVKRLGSIRRPHAVDLDHDETQVGERGEPVGGAEGLGDERALRPRIDLLDDRVLVRWIKVFGPADNAPDVRLAIAPLGDEDLGRLPAAGLERGRVGLVDLAYQVAVGRSPQLVNRSPVDPAVGIDQIAAIG